MICKSVPAEPSPKACCAKSYVTATAKGACVVTLAAFTGRNFSFYFLEVQQIDNQNYLSAELSICFGLRLLELTYLDRLRLIRGQCKAHV